MVEPPRLPPRATYRLQLNRDFTFAAAGQQAAYLAALGVSHVYLSPILAARAGSGHGYDVVDHDRLAPDLGTADEFRAMVAAFRRQELGVIVDIVPNHMGAGPENPRWMDLLRWGEASKNATFFDIDWEFAPPELKGRLVLPVLDRPLEDVLTAGEIRIEPEGDGFAACWHDQVWPITPPSVAGQDVGTLSSLSPETLHRLLDRQCWALVDRQYHSPGLNYRRFFAIDDLAAIRVDSRWVFDASHHLILKFVDEGLIDGLRIDHIDGLADPKTYLQWLDEAVQAAGREPYILVEKILGDGEGLRDAWPVAGTTGYDRLSTVDRLFCEPAGADRLIAGYRSTTGQSASAAERVRAAKLRFLETEYASEIARLGQAARALAAAVPALKDRPVEIFEAAFRALISRLPIYRCYVDHQGSTEEDRAWLDAAFADAPIDDPDLTRFLYGILTAEPALQALCGAEQALNLAFLFQQISGPAMAKGLEDTVFYRYVPLLALNEVGGIADPQPIEVEAFHTLTEAKRRAWPDELVAGSTHDTKRGEDARARLLGLTSAADEFEAALARWPDGRPAIEPTDRYYLYQSMLGAWPPGLRPDDVAGLADFAERLQPALLKAVREQKRRTSWTRPNTAYETGLDNFVGGLLDPTQSTAFLPDFAAFADRFGFWGALTSLSATLLRLTIPGIPDIYQGSETWNLSMVDPDNRRPVDFAAAAARLDATLPPMADIPACWHDGSLKSTLVRETLKLRRQWPAVFASGDYRPLHPTGAFRDCLIAFTREAPAENVTVLAPRFWPRLWPAKNSPPQWADTRVRLSPGRYRDVLTGTIHNVGSASDLSVADLLSNFPCAVLARDISPY